jgi:hypothetical protein
MSAVSMVFKWVALFKRLMVGMKETKLVLTNGNTTDRGLAASSGGDQQLSLSVFLP